MQRGCDIGTAGSIAIHVSPGNTALKVVQERTMALMPAEGNWGYCYGTPGGDRLCRLCYALIRRNSYTDIEENCPFSFLRLYDLMKKQCRSFVDIGRPAPAIGSAPRSHVARAVRAISMFLNKRSPGCLDVLYVHSDFRQYTFLSADTRECNGRQVVGIVELRDHKNHLSWGVVNRFVVDDQTVFKYRGQPLVNASKRCERTSAPEATICEYFTPTWHKRPGSIMSAVRLSGFDSKQLNRIYMFAGYNSTVRGRRQDTPYYESAEGCILYAAERVWAVRKDDCVLASTTNNKAVWNPAHGQLDGQWVMYDHAGKKLVQAVSKCRPVTHAEESCLEGQHLEALYDMKVLDAFGVALGGCSTFDCKQLPWPPGAHNPVARVSNTLWVRLEIRESCRGALKSSQDETAKLIWVDRLHRAMVQDLIFVPISICSHLAFSNPGLEIRVFDQHGRPLGIAEKILPKVVNTRFVVLKLVKPDIRVDSTSSKRKFSGAVDRANHEPAKRSKSNNGDGDSASSFASGTGARASVLPPSTGMTAFPRNAARPRVTTLFTRQRAAYSLTLPTCDHSLQKGDQVRLVCANKPVCWRTVESCGKGEVFLRETLMPKPEQGTLVVGTWGCVLAIILEPTTGPTSPERVCANDLTSRGVAEYLRNASLAHTATVKGELKQSAVAEGRTYTSSAVSSGSERSFGSVDQISRAKPLGAKLHTAFDTSNEYICAGFVNRGDTNELLFKGADVSPLPPGTPLLDENGVLVAIVKARSKDNPGAGHVYAQYLGPSHTPLPKKKIPFSKPLVLRSAPEGSRAEIKSTQISDKAEVTEARVRSTQPEARVQKAQVKVKKAKAKKAPVNADAARASLELLVQVSL